MSEVYPTFPATFKGGYEKIPQHMLDYPGEDTQPLLLDTQRQPVARLITFERKDINSKALQNLSPEDYEKYLGLLHERTPEGTVKTPSRHIMYFTADPKLSQEDATKDVTDMLTRYGAYQPPSKSAEAAQTGAEIGGPLAGAVAGGQIGFGLTGHPLGAIVGAGLGGALGGALPHMTRSWLTPEQIEMDKEAPYHEHDLASEMGMGAIGGITGETGSQLLQLGTRGAGALSRRLFIKGVEMSPEEATLFTPGGAYDQARAITGETGYGRISNYLRGTVREIDRYVSGGLFARSRSENLQRSWQQNRDALTTDYLSKINASGETANVGERILNWLETDTSWRTAKTRPDTMLRGAKEMQQGMYGYGKMLADAAGAPSPVETQVANDFFTARPNSIGESLRFQDRQAAARRIMQQLEINEPAITTTTSTGERTTFSQGNASQTGAVGERTTITPQGQRAVINTQEGASLTKPVQGPPGAPVPSSSGLVDAQGNPVMVPGPNQPGGTLSQQQTQTLQMTSQEKFPLAGQLMTLDPVTGQVSPNIDIGRARQLLQATGRASREETDPDVRSALDRFARLLRGQTEDAMERIDPAVRTAYHEADVFTSNMYKTLRSDLIVGDVVNTLNNNPETFAQLASHPQRTQILNGMRDAFYFGQRIDPKLIPPGMTLPSSLRDSKAFFDDIIIPEMQFQALKHYAIDPAMHTRLQATVAGNDTAQTLLQQGRLISIAPGKLTTMRASMGEETFDMLMGGPQASERWMTLDRYLQSGSTPGAEQPLSLAIVITQFGGFSLATTAAYKAAQGEMTQAAVGLVGAGTLVFTAPMLNRVLTDPARFEQLVLGIATANRTDPRWLRWATQIATQTANQYFRPFSGAVGPSRVQQEPDEK